MGWGCGASIELIDRSALQNFSYIYIYIYISVRMSRLRWATYLRHERAALQEVPLLVQRDVPAVVGLLLLPRVLAHVHAAAREEGEAAIWRVCVCGVCSVVGRQGMDRGQVRGGSQQPECTESGVGAHRVPSTYGRTFGPLDSAGVVQAVVHPHQLLHRARGLAPWMYCIRVRKGVFLGVKIRLEARHGLCLESSYRRRETYGSGGMEAMVLPGACARGRQAQPAASSRQSQRAVLLGAAHERSIAASDLDEPWDRSAPTGRRTMAQYACACRCRGQGAFCEFEACEMRPVSKRRAAFHLSPALARCRAHR